MTTPPTPHTRVSIQDDKFCVNGLPLHQGRTHSGASIEGLLLNARLVQATFEDLNPQTQTKWDRPGKPFDPDRNTDEFIAALPDYRAHGLDGFTINLQGGSPEGYTPDKRQPWLNTAFDADGSLREPYTARVARVLQAADELGFVVILGLFYFGQDQHLEDEAAVIRAVENAVRWVVGSGHANVLIEIANECDMTQYEHAILTTPRAHELIGLAKRLSEGADHLPAQRLLVSTSTMGGVVTPPNIIETADFLLMHGNGVDDPVKIARMCHGVRADPAYMGQPVVFNEDDNHEFDEPDCNYLTAVSNRAGWGFFDYRRKGEGDDEGFQSVPTNWSPRSSQRKAAFFDLTKRLAGL